MYLGLVPDCKSLKSDVGGMAFSTVGILLADFVETQKPASVIEKQEIELMSPILVVDQKKEN
ncbi:unnamed protein product [Rhizopus stolonifer]